MRTFQSMIGATRVSSSRREALQVHLRNWMQLYPLLSTMTPCEESLQACRELMVTELARDTGPRDHIMDRLYKRFSNLRRDMETTAMADAMLKATTWSAAPATGAALA
jgi:hypothetical protein